MMRLMGSGGTESLEVSEDGMSERIEKHMKRWCTSHLVVRNLEEAAVLFADRPFFFENCRDLLAQANGLAVLVRWTGVGRRRKFHMSLGATLDSLEKGDAR